MKYKIQKGVKVLKKKMSQMPDEDGMRIQECLLEEVAGVVS